MIATLRLLTCASAIALAGYILELAHPSWVAELATDLWALPSIRADLYEELEFGGKLEVQMSALESRALAKQRILNGVIDERFTLIDAAARYCELDRVPPSEPD